MVISVHVHLQWTNFFIFHEVRGKWGLLHLPWCMRIIIKLVSDMVFYALLTKSCLFFNLIESLHLFGCLDLATVSLLLIFCSDSLNSNFWFSSFYVYCFISHLYFFIHFLQIWVCIHQPKLERSVWLWRVLYDN